MWKKAKRFLAVLLALTLMLSVVDSEELFVSASATNVQEDTGAGGETEPAAGEETKSTDVSVEEDTAVTSVGDEGSGEDTATVPGDGTGTGTETGGAADATGTDGAETAGTGTETSGSGTEGAEGTTVPGSETPANGTEGTEGAAGTGDTTAGESGETEGDVTDGTTEAADDGTDGTTTAPGTVTDGIGSEGTGMETETGENGTVGTEQSDVVTGETEDGMTADIETDTESEENTQTQETGTESDDEPLAEAQLYEASVGDISVKVSVPDGAIPEESVLVAEEAVAEDVESTMQQEAIEYEGYMALDIRFEKNGEEVEPLFPVTVAFVMEEDAIPVEAEASVHHLVENEHGNVEKVETLEQVSPSSMPEVETTVIAEDDAENTKVLAVETASFSTFVITWTITTDDNVTIELPVELLPVDEEGISIGDGIETPIAVAANNEQSVMLSEQVADNNVGEIHANGHTYLYNFSAAGGYTTNNQIEQLRAGYIGRSVEPSNGNGYWEGESWKRNVTVTTTYYYGVWSGENAPEDVTDMSVIAYRTYTTSVTKTQTWWVFGGWIDDQGSESSPVVSDPSELMIRKNVYLVYERQPDSIMEHTDEVHLDKYVEANEDGTYTLTLTSYVTGTAGEEATDTDFVLVLDCSGSMTWGFGSAVSHDQLDVEKAQLYGNARSSDSYYTTSSPNNQGSAAGANSAVYYQNGRWYAGQSPLGNNQNVYVRRIGALKEAACSFIDELYRQDSTGHYRVGIVEFETNTDTTHLIELNSAQNVDNLKAVILSLHADGGTQSGSGMEAANTELRSGYARSSAEKVAVLFTDGTPGQSGWSTSVANEAIENAYKIKASTATQVEEGTYWNPDGQYGLGGKVYSISIVNGSNPNSIESNMDKYMNYVSSNYPTAQSMTNAGTGGSPGTTYYKVAEDVTDLIDAFKEAAGGAGISLDADTEVRDYLAANFELATDSEDDISVYTQKATGYSNGSYTFDGENVNYDAGVSIDSENGVITVKGFNYSAAENYVSGAENGPFSGKMLVVKINIKYTDENCFGGNNIPTNTSDTAIYADADGDGAADKVKEYPEPLVNIPINYQATSKDQTIYVMNSADLNAMLDYVTSGTKNYTPDGVNNRYVDIVYSFSDGSSTYYYKIPAMTQANAGSWYSDVDCTIPLNNSQIGDLMECTGYSVTCTVKPLEEPHEDNAGRLSVGTAAVITYITPEHATAQVHVLYPSVECEDQWIDIGDSINVSIIGEKTGWYDPTTGHIGYPAVSGTEPEVTIETREYGETGIATTVSPEEDTDYVLTVKVGSTDVTDETQITKDQQVENAAGDQHTVDCYDHVTADTHEGTVYDFRVHVIGYTITVIKNVDGNMGDQDSTTKFPFEYNVTGTNGIGSASDTFELSHQEQYIISKVRKGSVVSIIESGTYDDQGYNTDGYKTTVTVDSGTANASNEAASYETDNAGITGNTQITFKNERDVKPPTGFVDNNSAYLVMVLCASGVAVWCGAMYLIRRTIKRRHR